ncbi:MAG TPA: endonuclease/exonuclease/phosphatase family protein [Vicinamibacterales bacterium]|nr:endonuclease/exonuclease/phosphatase family protein [Vicinamibacterales bacterium]
MRLALSFSVAILAAALTTAPPPAGRLVKLAFYNIESGKGAQGLRGHRVAFANTSNCTNASKPMNAWGAGVVQKTLTSAIGDDPAAVALGLAEAWQAVCASPKHVRDVLGWNAASSVHNGVALVARYGLRDERWLPLDISHNRNPKDTAWVLHARVCLDERCGQTLPFYVAHWYGTGPDSVATYETQAKQTVAFMQQTSGDEPHVLMGDLNVWEAAGPVCGKHPNGERPLQVLRAAGYIDAWPKVHPRAPGFTGMVNRPCGTPEGNVTRRADYAWSSPGLLPTAMERFGIAPPGDPSPSDHLGVIAAYDVPR